jgi:hypothetical protein
MGWEKRQRGSGAYYVMKTRFGNSVVSHYVGKGETADLISQMQEIYAEKARCEAWKRQHDRERSVWEQQLDAYCADVRGIFRREMEAAGWYLHRREWRRGSMARAAQVKMEPLITRAQRDPAAAQELLAQWKERNVVKENLDLVYETYFGYSGKRSGQNGLLQAAIDQKTEHMRRELTTEGDTALEQMLIERVIVCYHAMNDAEGKLQNLNQQDGVTLTKIEHYDKTTDRAQRRYLTAVRELGLARRLRLPAKEAQKEETRLRTIAGGKPSAPHEIEEVA